MTDAELKSCIGTIEMLRRLHGVMNVIDAGNCEKIIKVLSDIPKYKDAYNKGWEDGAKASYEHLKMCEEEQETKWIPVSEHEPEDMCYVWLTCISKVDDREPWVCDGFYNPYYTGDKYSKWGNIPMLNWGDAEVIAWMEQDIPEPYKVEPQESEDKE